MKIFNQPLVSIITPSFNQGYYIEETILSVLNQTYSNIQYIIIDGGSTDQTMQIIEKYKEKINIVISEKDSGQTNAINKGFKLAMGELVGWINSDDILYEDCVENIVNTFNKTPNQAIYYSSKIDIINERGLLIRKSFLPIYTINDLIHKEYSLNQQGSFYRLDFIKQIGFLDENVHYCMDLDLFLRLFRFGGVGLYNEKSLAGFRIWGETKTSNGKNVFIREIRNTLLKHGAKWYSPTIIKTFKFDLIFKIKQIMKI